ncbi:fungal specific transcription factor domain-containing protein [Trichoderma gamsii]|uniref:Fungal specific transcription factor domain-containing protein n=1 Tax=Trichoderma gamsii TaxID=398673 RepID=A0A2P4ZM43_9HYPO|nr:fungal specific transcription factor domain-containing protein [Trichoderma gamsii]PON25361.1 fungal specific transcription factor domain-containing protein [Trichoderma gamsii]
MSAAAHEVPHRPAVISMAASEEDVNRAAVDEATLQPTPVSTRRISSSLRRRACDACRARKVRCDTLDPCNRCIKMGAACHYSGRAKPTNSRIGMSRFLETLNNRLKQAEVQLASTHLMQQNQPQFPVAWREVDSTGLLITPLPPHEISPQAEAQSHWNSVPAPIYPIHVFQESDATAPAISATEAPAYLSTNELTSSNFADIMMAQNILDNQPFEFKPAIFNIPSPASEPVPTGLNKMLQKFYERYFEVFHPIIPIINRSRFEHEISLPYPTSELQALSYAMGALAASSVPELQDYASFYHEQARNLIDLCERQESGDSLGNISFLEAYVILTLYELNQPNFARAYLTLGRAIKLVQILGLDSVKSKLGSARWGFSKEPNHSISLAEQEERRRVFWSLFILDSFASLRSSISPTFTGVINIPLPSSSEYPDFLDEKMPRLDQVFDLTETVLLSSFAANTLMISLYQRYFRHVESSYNEMSQGFWETHYAIDNAVEHCRATLLAPHMNGNSGNDPLAVGLRMNLDSIKINLHETALFRVEKDQLPENLATDANSKCAFAVTDIVRTVQVGLQLTGSRAVTFRQLSRFFVWPITTAIQVCFRMLYTGTGDFASYISFLRILSHAMKEIIDPDQIPPGLFENAEAKIADAARGVRRK